MLQEIFDKLLCDFLYGLSFRINSGLDKETESHCKNMLCKCKAESKNRHINSDLYEVKTLKNILEKYVIDVRNSILTNDNPQVVKNFVKMIKNSVESKKWDVYKEDDSRNFGCEVFINENNFEYYVEDEDAILVIHAKLTNTNNGEYLARVLTDIKTEIAFDNNDNGVRNFIVNIDPR